MYSKIALLWTTRISDLAVEVSPSAWIERVLPGLGFDRLRLLEVTLPSAGGLVPAEVVTHFDAARRGYDIGNYQECVEKCRYARDALTRHLGITRDRRLGDVVTDRLGMAPDVPVRAFLNGLWQAWWDVTNAGHHNLAPKPFPPRTRGHAS